MSIHVDARPRLPPPPATPTKPTLAAKVEAPATPGITEVSVPAPIDQLLAAAPAPAPQALLESFLAFAPASAEAQERVKDALGPLADLIQSAPPAPGAEPAQAASLAAQDWAPSGRQAESAIFQKLANLFRRMPERPSARAELCEQIGALLQQTQLLYPQNMPATRPLPANVAAQLRQMTKLDQQKTTTSAPINDVLESASAASADAPAGEGEVVLPGPELVRIEHALVSSGIDLSAIDIEMAVAIVMFEIGRSADDDLKQLLEDMKAGAAKKKAMRDARTQLQQRQRTAESALHAEYDSRKRLPSDDPLFIGPDVTFDDYARDRPIGLPRDANGRFDPALDATFSGSGPLYPPPPAPAPPTDSFDPSVDEPGTVSTQNNTPEPVELNDEQTTVVGQLGLSPQLAQEAAGVYNLLKEAFDDVPAFDVFCTDGKWLAETFGITLGSGSANLETVLKNRLSAVRSVLAKPATFEARAADMYEQLITIDFFLASQNEGKGSANFERDMATLQAKREQLAQALDRATRAGGVLFGTKFQRDLAADKVDAFTQLTEDAHELINMREADSVLLGYFATSPNAAGPLGLVSRFALLIKDLGFDDKPPSTMDRLLYYDNKDERSANDYLLGNKPDAELAAAMQAPLDPGLAAEIIALIPEAKRGGYRRPAAGPPVNTGYATSRGEQGNSATSIDLAPQGRFADYQLELDRMRDEMDSLSEMGERQQTQLQMYMERRTKAQTTLSNLLKKMEDVGSSIIGNLK